MASVGTHSVRPFAGPVNRVNNVVDANEVRGNDDAIRRAYVAHDADPTIHIQSSTLATRPAAGVAGRIWITADNGFYSFWYDDGARWHEIGNDHIDIEVICNQTGGLVAGDVVKVVGFNNGQNLPIVARVSSTTDVAFAIASESIANNARGYVINTGIVNQIDTSAYALGDILYPDGTGSFTTVKPTTGNYQVSAYVLYSNANQGTLYVEFSAPRIVETASDTASTIVLRDSNGSTALQGLVLTNLPTSATGLPAGTVWNNSGTLRIA